MVNSKINALPLKDTLIVYINQGAVKEGEHQGQVHQGQELEILRSLVQPNFKITCIFKPAYDL